MQMTPICTIAITLVFFGCSDSPTGPTDIHTDTRSVAVAPPVPAPSSPPVNPIIDGVPGGTGQPSISITYVPDLGTFTDLRGTALHVPPDDYRVAVLIKVEGTWWTKPTFNQSLTRIASDGTWVCDITTGGADSLATEIAAFLIPAGYTPPLANGTTVIPSGLAASAAATTTFRREHVMKTIVFSGYAWHVKHSFDSRIGPGPNYFSDSANNVFVDEAGNLHLKISKNGSAFSWRCAEVILDHPLGYGQYIFTLESGFEQMDSNAVLGLFTWDTAAPQFNYREIDIEFSRWGVHSNPNSQFVVQPYSRSGNMFRFETQPSPMSIHSIGWSRQSVTFKSNNTTWDYAGPSVPPAGDERARINLWLINGREPSGDVEVVIRSFAFIPF